MSEVVSISTGEPWEPKPSASMALQIQTKSLIERIFTSFIAKKNDKVRKSIPLAKIYASPAIKEVMTSDNGEKLRILYSKFKDAHYNEINFGTLTADMISNDKRTEFEETHSAGLIHTSDNPETSVVWQIDQKTSQASFYLASEFFDYGRT